MGTSVGGARRRFRQNMLHNNDKHKDQTTVELESPTSISMMNSFIIKNADPSFETYYN